MGPAKGLWLVGTALSLAAGLWCLAQEDKEVATALC
jgi:hypothetical protein